MCCVFMNFLGFFLEPYQLRHTFSRIQAIYKRQHVIQRISSQPAENSHSTNCQLLEAMAHLPPIVAFSAVFLLGAISCAPSDSQLNRIETTIKFVNNTETTELRNFGLKLEPVAKRVGFEFQYKYGYRSSGDQLVGQNSHNKSFPTAMDYILDIFYPSESESDQGAYITFVSITVETSNDNDAYITWGGPGMRNIHVVVRAGSTTFFNCHIEIYGF
jgi:Transcription activator MBF2